MKYLLLLTIPFLLTGCMTKQEAWLRGKQLDNAGKHPTDYQVLAIKGPVTLGEGAVIEAKAPTQPYQKQEIPDGGQQQLSALNTAAIVGGAIYGASRIKGNTTKTTINNNGGTPSTAP